MAATRRPDRARRVRWLAFLLGLLVGAALWWFLFHLARHGPPRGRDGRSTGDNTMFQRTPQIAAALFLLTVPLAAAAATDQGHGQAPATKVKKPAKPGKAMAKPAAKTASPPGRGIIPPGMAGHHPPAPPPGHSHYEVPQPKSVADTPDMVLNSRVRASLMSALTAAGEADITSQTAKRVVTLTGSVKTKELRSRAVQVASHVHGVRAVRNRLTVK